MKPLLNYQKFLSTYKTRSHRIRHLENYKYLFPIIPNKILAGVVADLFCDGSLQGDPKWRIDYTSGSVEELKRFEKEIFLLFKKTGKIRPCSTNKLSKSYNIGINCSPIARILFLCGVPSGQKVLSQIRIPVWIKKDKELFRRFAQRVFSCEGTIMHEKRRKIPQIRLNMSCIKGMENLFIKDLGQFLKKHFGINSTIRAQSGFNIRKDKTETYKTRIYIFNDSVLRFFSEIGFEGTKQKSLKAILNSKK